MTKARTSIVSWITLLAAVSLWGAVGFFAWTLMGTFDARAAASVDTEAADARQAANLRLHATARDTKDARAALENIGTVGIVAVVDAIDAVGKDAGVKLTLGQSLSAAPDNKAPLHSVDFVVEANGSFETVVHVAKLLSLLPIPSAVDQFQFGQIPNTDKGPVLWRVVVHMHALTSSDVSI